MAYIYMAYIYIYKLLYYRCTSHGYSIFRSRLKLLQVRGDNKKFPNYWGDLGDWRLAGGEEMNPI